METISSHSAGYNEKTLSYFPLIIYILYFKGIAYLNDMLSRICCFFFLFFNF